MKIQPLKSIFLFCILHLVFRINSNAQIVYTDIPDTTISSPYSFGARSFNVDINNDGSADFAFSAWHIGGHGHSNSYVAISALNNNQILDTIINTAYFTKPLDSNSVIKGTSSSWHHDTFQYYGTFYGLSWLGTDRFIGVKIKSGSNNYYGWIRVNLLYVSTITVKDYAYDSIPNQSILAGETSCALPTVNLTQSGSLSFCAGDSVSFTANGTGYQYQWKKNNLNIAGATAKEYVAKTAGVYKCKVTNSCGSKTSGARTVTVPCRITNKNFIESLEQLSVFPNPATNSLTIIFPSDEEGTIQIVNLFGQIVFSKKVNAEQEQIDVSRFPAGMYVVRWSVRTPSESSGENNETKNFSIIK